MNILKHSENYFPNIPYCNIISVCLCRRTINAIQVVFNIGHGMAKFNDVCDKEF